MIRALSYGGGVDSTAVLVLAARGDIPLDVALFADVGRAENPDTKQYLNDVAIPFAERHGIPVTIVARTTRDGEIVDLWDNAIGPNRTIPVPMRMSNGAPGNRTCTELWKIKPIARELKAMGATKDDPALMALGIGIDEYQRMRDSRIPWIAHAYPLIDRRLGREHAKRIITNAGLPLPPKSSCIWCPFKRRDQWQELRRQHPDRFAQSVEFEREINRKRADLGRDHVWLTSALRPLDEAIPEPREDDDKQLPLFVDDGKTCDIGGYCFA